MSHIQYGSSDEEDYLGQKLPNSRGDFVNSLRKSVSIPSGKVFDPTHFCPSWCDCCRANLALKPKYPEIKRGMSVEDALKVWDAIECIWTGVCGDDNQKFYYSMKSVIFHASEGSILVNTLKMCRCCNRHIIHKPQFIDDVGWRKHVVPVGWEGSYRSEETCNCFIYSRREEPCACRCRQFSRQIQELFNF